MEDKQDPITECGISMMKYKMYCKYDSVEKVVKYDTVHNV